MLLEKSLLSFWWTNLFKIIFETDGNIVTATKVKMILIIDLLFVASAITNFLNLDTVASKDNNDDCKDYVSYLQSAEK